MARNETINERIWNQGQSWRYERIFSLGCGGTLHKLRTSFRHNAYNEQSWAKIERWNGSEWQTLHLIPGNALNRVFNYEVSNVKESDFEQLSETRELLKVALAVLS